MPVSKTAALEKRIEKLEQELNAYKRELTKRAPGSNAAARELANLRELVDRFFEAALCHGLLIWSAHPDVQRAAEQLVDAANPSRPRPHADPQTKRTPP